MTNPQQEIFDFIALNRLVAKGTLREHFQFCNIDEVLQSLEDEGVITSEIRPTIQGKTIFYRLSAIHR